MSCRQKVGVGKIILGSASGVPDQTLLAALSISDRVCLDLLVITLRGCRADGIRFPARDLTPTPLVRFSTRSIDDKHIPAQATPLDPNCGPRLQSWYLREGAR